QQNGVAERRNKTLIEAAKTMLADAKLLVTFWVEAVNTACYVQNKVLVNKSHNKTPYELFNGRTPVIGFLKREDLNQLWVLVKESLRNMPAISDKEKELWVELKRLFEPDVEDYIWTHTQNLMHALLEWKLYDTCGVHHVSTRDQDIFMLIEKDYPLRKGLALVMICYKLQVENYSQMANDLILKIYKIANSPRQQDD
nr:ribonuclease H-like domain-containing protein [Tanacetum cinerariifolium]